MLRNNIVRTWFSAMCGESCDDKTLWIKLIDFLEKDLRFTSKIQNNVREKKPAKWRNIAGNQNRLFNSNFTGSSTR